MQHKGRKICKKLGISQDNGKLLAVYAALFVLTFSVFYAPSIDATHCGKSKNTVTGGNNEAGDKWGNWGVLTPKEATICGSSYSDEGSYVHHMIVDLTSGTDQFVETGWYGGRNPNTNEATNGIHYVTIKNNAFGGGYAWTDLTKTTGQKPDINDNIRIKQNYAYTDAFGRDFYTVIVDNTTKGVRITQFDVHVNGKGKLALTQAESQNTANVMKGNSGSLKDMNTSQVWTDWTSSIGSREPNTSSNPYCFVKIAENSYKFGKLVSGSCSTG